ncbi:hypothetical protein ACGC1H_007609, partial [Rhizoctonia solani]
MIWFITEPGEDDTKGFHYDRVEAGSTISLGYPSPFVLDLCANGTGDFVQLISGMEQHVKATIALVFRKKE